MFDGSARAKPTGKESRNPSRDGLMTEDSDCQRSLFPRFSYSGEYPRRIGVIDLGSVLARLIRVLPQICRRSNRSSSGTDMATRQSDAMSNPIISAVSSADVLGPRSAGV